VPHDIYLILALLYDKVHLLSQNASRSFIFDKDYRKMILMYEREIEKNEEGMYSPFYFALLCNLHKHHKHAGAAMIAFDQLHYHLDTKPELQKYWDRTLNQIREMAKKKQSALQSENLENILEMVNSHISQTNNNQQNSTMLLSLLLDRVAELEEIEKIRNQVKIDQEYFKKDENVNRSVFYHKMRVSLSHKFTSMAVISGDDDNEPIVKHDRTGTETM
jgi:DNA-binding transcriptional regulator YiaG